MERRTVETPAKAPKPDGWHTYHVCGGVLRTLTMLGRKGTVSEATCENCGEWYRGVVTPERRDESVRT